MSTYTNRTIGTNVPEDPTAYPRRVTAELVALVLPLGLDTFAVAAALGMLAVGSPHRLRISVLFSSFEAGMPLIGVALEVPLGHAIGGAADYVAIGVLFAFGLYTLLSAEEHEEERLARLAQMRGPGHCFSASASASTSLRSASRWVYCGSLSHWSSR